MTNVLLYIQIENEIPVDIRHYHGLHLLESSNITAFEPKGAFVQEFPEEDGERYIPSMMFKACDYYVILGYYLDRDEHSEQNPYNNYNVNHYLSTLHGKKLTLFNNLKKNKIVCYLSNIETLKVERKKTSSLRDLCEIKLTFRINDPSLCNLMYVES